MVGQAGCLVVGPQLDEVGQDAPVENSLHNHKNSIISHSNNS